MMIGPNVAIDKANNSELSLGPIPPGVKGVELHQLLVDAANGKGISPEKVAMFGTLPQVPLPEQKPLVTS